MPRILAVAIAFLCLGFTARPALATPSVARRWNEAMLSSIRQDLARPTVQARNLFHFSIAASTMRPTTRR